MPEGPVNRPAVRLEGERAMKFIRAHGIGIVAHQSDHAVMRILTVVRRHINHPAVLRGVEFRRP
ncbi:MAG: hypothetical protein EBV49_15595 [Betaproteobacteria bacterium]|nr:hypothetical protein [Betaproteobacteria bacterium]